ncbi:Sarcosine oxidase subunit alpha [Nymphon striatum]|nr:Sarcosine oxidase subunit alpha [Nymphon striatum]
MSTRLATPGRLTDQTKPLNFTFNGKNLRGYAGDTLASALLANDQMLVGRSFKYHRPRGIVASGPEEPNALVNLGEESRFEPNQRVTTTELFDGLAAKSQNHWPSLEFDALAKRPKPATPIPTNISMPFCDVLIVGGGVAGLQAALTAGRAGARVILFEQSDHWGGRAPVDGGISQRRACGQVRG